MESTLTIRRVSLDSLELAPGNARTHDEKNLARLLASAAAITLTERHYVSLGTEEIRVALQGMPVIHTNLKGAG